MDYIYKEYLDDWGRVALSCWTSIDSADDDSEICESCGYEIY